MIFSLFPTSVIGFQMKQGVKVQHYIFHGGWDLSPAKNQVPLFDQTYSFKYCHPEKQQDWRRIMTREETLQEAERRGYEYEQKYRV
jgi:hypothetical protein